METCASLDKNNAFVDHGAAHQDEMRATGVYVVACYDSDGNLKWSDHALNLICNQGKNSLLDVYFASSSYSAAFVMSLITAGSATATSTYASPTVTEIGSGIIASNTRPAVTWNAAATGSKSATTTTFNITGSATITGNMLLTGGTGVGTVGNTSATGGVLFSAANFAAGSETVSNGDILNVSYSVSV